MEQPKEKEVTERSIVKRKEEKKEEEEEKVVTRRTYIEREESERGLRRCLPNGEPCCGEGKCNMRLLHTLLILSLLAWICLIVAVMHCTFLILHTNINEVPQVQGLGLWSEAYFEQGELRGCLTFNDSTTFSGMVNKARYLGAITAGLAILSFILLTIIIIFCARLGWQKALLTIVRIINPLAFVLGGFMFGFYTLETCYTENAYCEPGLAGIIGAVGVTILFFVSVLGFFVTVPPQPMLIPVWEVEQYYQKKTTTTEEEKAVVVTSDSESDAPERQIVKYEKPETSMVVRDSNNSEHMMNNYSERSTASNPRSVPPSRPPTSPRKTSMPPPPASPRRSMNQPPPLASPRKSPMPPPPASPRRSMKNQPPPVKGISSQSPSTPRKRPGKGIASKSPVKCIASQQQQPVGSSPRKSATKYKQQG